MTATASSTPTVQRPTSVDEAAKVLRDSGGCVLFRGAGTKWIRLDTQALAKGRRTAQASSAASISPRR